MYENFAKKCAWCQISGMAQHDTNHPGGIMMLVCFTFEQLL
jgi:hypothetical protein